MKRDIRGETWGSSAIELEVRDSDPGSGASTRATTRQITVRKINPDEDCSLA